ncbi:MAG: hypothetical protein GYA35_08375 [Thermoanaerobaculaceae bacterium]|nr:hypothetical protein [Thermoanaerobaculaceae bacterium]
MFQVAEGKLPADCMVYYLFSPVRFVRKNYSIDKFGFILWQIWVKFSKLIGIKKGGFRPLLSLMPHLLFFLFFL